MKLKFIFFNALIFAFFYAESSFAQRVIHKTPKTVFAFIHDYAAIRESPDSNSREIYSARFGEWLTVTKSYKNWFEVTAPDRSVGYIRKSDVVNSVTQIPLTNGELAEIYLFDPDDTTKRYPNIELKLISKKQFYAMRKTAVNYFVADTNSIKRHKQTIKLPLKKGYKLLVDRPDGNGIDSNINSYVGQYPFLNKYVVFNCDGEAEECSYNLIDKTTGKFDSTSFTDFPYLSIDKKFLLSIHGDEENYADLTVAKLTGKTIRQYAYGQFKNWVPAESKDQFWGGDGWFYLPVIPSAAYNQSFYEKKPPGYNFRYIKIKVKGPSKIPKY